MSITARAAIYSRNSSAKQKSIDDQTAENRAVALANGWKVIAELSDPISASRYATRARDDWAALIALLPTIDVVVLWEPSRGDRSLATWAAFLDTCRAHQVQIHAVTHRRTYDPRVARDYRSLAEDGVDSAYESDKISERTLRGLATVMALGRPHGALAYGYKRIYDERGNLVEQVVNSSTAPVVRDLFASIARGESLNSLCVRLTRDQVPTPKGGRVWHASTITGIIRNPIYRPHVADPERGCRTHEGRVLDNPAAWPPLVDETAWYGANTVLGTFDESVRLERRGSAPGGIRYLLSGNASVMTSACGASLCGYRANAKRNVYYACGHDKCVSVTMPETDEYVARLVVGRFCLPDARALWAPDDAGTRQAAKDLRRLSAELEEARQSFATPGGISAEAMAAKERAMAPVIADAERRARPSGVPLAALELLDAAELEVERVRPTWEAFPLAAKREIIAGIFTALVLEKSTARVTRWTDPDERRAIVAERIRHEWRG